jgi:hypothetical protein
VYHFQSVDNDLFQVTAINGSGFPNEAEPYDDPYHSRSLSKTITKTTIHSNRSLLEDGSRIDVICFYTRKALCAEANQASTCNLNQYKYLMDNKCALAIAETVCIYLLNWIGLYFFLYLTLTPRMVPLTLECSLSE